MEATLECDEFVFFWYWQTDWTVWRFVFASRSYIGIFAQFATVDGPSGGLLTHELMCFNRAL